MTRPNSRVSAIIPAHNEAARISETVKAVMGIPEIDQVVVVDDASTDDTAELAQAAGAVVQVLRENLGKGGALNHGAALVTGDVVVLLDGDLGSSAAEARGLLLPVLEGSADMTVARFPRSRKKGGFGLVKGLARSGIKHFCGFEAQAPLSGQRAMTRAVLKQVVPFASGYGVEVALTIAVARQGFRVLEVPVNMTHAETGRDLRGFVHRGQQFVHVARVLAGCMIKYHLR